MKLVAVCAIALTAGLAGCDAKRQSNDANPVRMASVKTDGSGGDAPEGYPLSSVPDTKPGKWRVTITRDGKKSGRTESCVQARTVKSLIYSFGHAADCTKRTFKKESAQAWAYHATCKNGTFPTTMDVRITGNMASYYTVDLRRTRNSAKFGMSFESIVANGERVGDC